jgi:AcrR family transcriptional regulator
VSPIRQQAAKREAILEAALGEFLADGFTDTSVDRIAAAAGVSKQTIYNHFGDKKQLFIEVLRDRQRQVGVFPDDELAEQLGEADDLAAALGRYAREAIRVMLRPDIVALRRLVLAEAGRHPEILDEWTRRRPQAEALLVTVIERQAARGRLDVPDPALAAHQLTIVLFTEAHARSLYGLRKLSRAEIGQIADTGIDLWLRAYRRR